MPAPTTLGRGTCNDRKDGVAHDWLTMKSGLHAGKVSAVRLSIVGWAVGPTDPRPSFEPASSGRR
jgi:hypothetical protein